VKLPVTLTVELQLQLLLAAHQGMVDVVLLSCYLMAAAGENMPCPMISA
jgi:hypothetical protein